MNYIVKYDQWKSLYESTGQVELNIKDLENKILSKLPKGVTIDDLKKKLASFTPIELSEEPIQPEGPIPTIESKKLFESIDWEAWIDIAIDIISGILEGFPGIGTVASATVDVLHTVSYLLRFFFVSDEASKIKYLVLTGLGMATSFIPMAGNVTNIAGRSTIGNILRVSPSKIYGAIAKLKGKNLPLSHWSNFAKWKINFVYVLLKVLGNFGEDVLVKISGFFNSLSKKLVAALTNWANSSVLTGWICTDYTIPAINKVKSYFEVISSMTSIKELAAL
jgi:hypothetical protein